MKFLTATAFIFALSAAGCVVSPEPDSTPVDDSVDKVEEAADACKKAKVGAICGGFAGITCDKGLYCAFGPNCGAGDQTGVCAVKPGACIQIYNPICGCDGNTYGNACNAASAGVSVASQGECEPTTPVVGEGESCGGFRAGPPPECAQGLYCKYEVGDTCGWADAPGTCASKPDACTKEYAPVCSCNGNTYGNACEAAANGASVLHKGPCS